MIAAETGSQRLDGMTLFGNGVRMAAAPVPVVVRGS